jgi:hypothetical protein
VVPPPGPNLFRDRWPKPSEAVTRRKITWLTPSVFDTLGERLYHNSFVTSQPLDDFQVKEVTHAGRARWKHENEGHNVLTTRGYHIKHNFGHGHQHLATVMFSLNLPAFFPAHLSTPGGHHLPADS